MTTYYILREQQLVDKIDILPTAWSHLIPSILAASKNWPASPCIELPTPSSYQEMMVRGAIMAATFNSINSDGNPRVNKMQAMGQMTYDLLLSVCQ